MVNWFWLWKLVAWWGLTSAEKKDLKFVPRRCFGVWLKFLDFNSLWYCGSVVGVFNIIISMLYCQIYLFVEHLSSVNFEGLTVRSAQEKSDNWFSWILAIFNKNWFPITVIQFMLWSRVYLHLYWSLSLWLWSRASSLCSYDSIACKSK